MSRFWALGSENPNFPFLWVTALTIVHALTCYTMILRIGVLIYSAPQLQECLLTPTSLNDRDVRCWRMMLCASRVCRVRMQCLQWRSSTWNIRSSTRCRPVTIRCSTSSNNSCTSSSAASPSKSVRSIQQQAATTSPKMYSHRADPTCFWPGRSTLRIFAQTEASQCCLSESLWNFNVKRMMQSVAI